MCLITHPLCSGRMARNSWYDPLLFLTLRLAHFHSTGIKSPLGGPWARSPRRTRPRTPLDPFLLHLCTVQHIVIPNKVPYLDREPLSQPTTSHSTKLGPLSIQLPHICHFERARSSQPGNREEQHKTYLPKPDLGHFTPSEGFDNEKSIDLFPRPLS